VLCFLCPACEKDIASSAEGAQQANTHEGGVKVSDAEMARLDITGDQFHPERHYAIKLRQSTIA
jgi:hypothetical protein